jgi:hypothetical protein
LNNCQLEVWWTARPGGVNWRGRSSTLQDGAKSTLACALKQKRRKRKRATTKASGAANAISDIEGPDRRRPQRDNLSPHTRSRAASRKYIGSALDVRKTSVKQPESSYEHSADSDEAGHAFELQAGHSDLFVGTLA